MALPRLALQAFASCSIPSQVYFCSLPHKLEASFAPLLLQVLESESANLPRRDARVVQ